MVGRADKTWTRAAQKRRGLKKSYVLEDIYILFIIYLYRWRTIFNKTLELRIKKCSKVIAACCVLHNMCVIGNDIFEQPQDVPVRQVANGAEGQDQYLARQYRDMLCDQLNQEQ